MGILDGKKLLITGVLTEESLAFEVAQVAIREGAQVLLSGFGRGLSLTKRVARRLEQQVEVIELDVTSGEQLADATKAVKSALGHIDGLLHAIGFAPADCLGQGILTAEWPDVATTLEVSAYSLKALAKSFLTLFPSTGGSIVGLDFDATVAWPAYDWMGVAKASLESLTRYLARDLASRNVRVNLVAAGPIRSMAAKSIPGFEEFEKAWVERAPLGWDVGSDREAVARACVALFSDWFPRTTGEIIHVDGGYHAVGA